MRPLLRALLLFIGLSSTLACQACEGEPAASAGPGAPPSATPAAPDPLGPPTRAQLPTTDGDDSVANLSGQIEALERLIAGDGPQIGNRRQLVSLLSTRARFLGRIADAERASVLAEDLVRRAPRETWPLVLRASTRAALHLFSAALADLDEAKKRGVAEDDLAEDRAAILEGQGDLDGALTIRTARRKLRADITSCGLEAALLGRLGRAEEARALFLQATSDVRSVSAFPVAWLFLQEGLFWESSGEISRARAYYQAAHERLPAYGHAASHLALLVPPARGVEILTPIVAASDDPEFELVLAGRLRAAGQVDAAEARLAHVRARYAALVDRHPEAFAEHAGWFLLDDGKDPAAALALARKNLSVRRTEKAYQLALLAALAAGKREEACALGREAHAVPHAGEMLRGIADRACQGIGGDAGVRAGP